MSIFRTSAASYFHLDENASGGTSGTGGGVAAPSGGSPAPSSGEGNGGAVPGSPAPSSGAGETPSSSAPAAEAADPFGGLDDDFDSVVFGEGDGTGTVPGATPAPGSEAAPAPSPTPAPVAPPEPAAVPAAVVPPDAASPPSNEPSAPRSKVEAFVRDLDKEETSTALAGWASENLFKLSKEEADALDTDAMSVIPKLMGRAYAQALKSAGALIHNLVPELIQQGVVQHTKAAAKSNEASDQFYAAHPELNKRDHDAVVAQWAKAFRTMNPKASRAEAIEFVGRAVKSQLNIQPGQRPVGNGSAPFVPARPGGVHVPVPASQGNDPYAGMDQDFD